MICITRVGLINFYLLIAIDLILYEEMIALTNLYVYVLLDAHSKKKFNERKERSMFLPIKKTIACHAKIPIIHSA